MYLVCHFRSESCPLVVRESMSSHCCPKMSCHYLLWRQFTLKAESNSSVTGHSTNWNFARVYLSDGLKDLATINSRFKPSMEEACECWCPFPSLIMMTQTPEIATGKGQRFFKCWLCSPESNFTTWGRGLTVKWTIQSHCQYCHHP